MQSLARLVFALCSCLAIAGCVEPSPLFTPSGAVRYAPLPDRCPLVIASAVPEGFEEIGVIDLNTSGSTGAPKTQSTFKRLIAPTVCRTGGELVVAQANGVGEYVRGTIYRAKPAAA